ncbi:hypothetical protein [Rhizosphaericola mali]|uniref:Uncharacterized protein n=1 Tax=Rhizosphaericola mali TaxID=2545455 RepID=A0A5P2GB40_9BACT|nr:hypothetical protein [Rhizosphaericola mali]QES88052.1 hypothetical protein E0W69_005030 [Rhizosphaericola mali]QES88771.1 hypothetical protein E0W69_008940 [Rhizosphaericola mali]
MKNEKSRLKNYFKDLYKNFRESVLPLNEKDSTIKKYSKNIGASAILVLAVVVFSVVVLAISFVL